MNDALKTISFAIESYCKDKSPEEVLAFVSAIRAILHESNIKTNAQPIDLVRWIPVSKLQANDYNPNSVALNEMTLLHTSIKHDGYTQPIVTVYDPLDDKYVIVDGFHRYSIMRNNQDIQATTGSHVPIVVIKKSINDRMASTVRHNRARGKHSVDGMADMIFQMISNGWDDKAICSEIGCTADELLRLKHVTGFSKLFENAEYSKSWETKHQVWLRSQYNKSVALTTKE